MFNAIGKTIKWIGQHFMGMLFLLIAFVVLMPTSSTQLRPANLQEIQLVGPIMNADAILKEIEDVQKDPKIKGVLLNINSPGGAVPPSIEIAYAIKALKKHKPVVAYASGIMASGSYYASIYANTIIANPGSIVGSIGVIMESANIEELMDTIGVKTQIVKQGKYKEAGTPTREWTADERAELERLTKDTYELFIKDELAFLEMADYPPFASLARILIAHKDETKASKITLDTVTKLKAFEAVEIVGHGKATIERIANKFRFHILLRAKHRVPLLKALHRVDRREIEIDFDPVEFS